MRERVIRYDSSLEFPWDNLEIPWFQRGINQTHVNDIMDHIKSSEKDLYIGVIEIAKYLGKYYVIDGQHRLMAIKNMSNVVIPFHVLEITVNEEEDMVRIFQLRNKNTEIPKFLKKKVPEKLYVDIHRKMVSKYTDMIKDEGCNRPHINMTFFLQKLKESTLFGFINGIKQFEIIIDFINKECKAKAMADKTFTERMRAKAEKYDCWLGYDKNYSYLSDMDKYKKLL